MSIFRRKKQTDAETESLKSFLDMIAPSIVKFETGYYICGNTFRCIWALREYPTSTDDLAILRHLGEKHGVTLHIYTRMVSPLEERKIVHNAEIRNRMNRGSSQNMQQAVEAESNLQDVANLIGSLHRNKEPLLHCAVYIEMIAGDMQELQILQTNVEVELMRSKLNVDRLKLRQQAGFCAVSPVGFNAFGTEYERVLPASSVANLFPFNYSGKTDRKGFYIGKDKYGSNIVVDFDQRDEDKTSANVLILGNSGQGKSYLMKLLLLNFLEAGKSVITLDVEHEQWELCQALGGCFADIIEGTYKINLLEPRCWDTDADPYDVDAPKAFRQSTRLAQHTSFLKDVFRTYKDFTTAQIDTIEIMLTKLYTEWGITEETDFSQMRPEDYPILSELYDFIEIEYENFDETKPQLYTRETLQQILLGLHSMCRGADSKFFNGHTNLTSTRFLVFGVKGLLSVAQNVRSTILLNLLSYMSDKLLTEGNTVAALDELYIWLSNPVMVRGLGMAPIVGAALDGHHALMLCVASLLLITFTRVLAVAVCHLTKNRFRPVIYSYAAALLYIPVYVLMYQLFGADLSLLGIYLPLLVVEPAIVKRMEFAELEPVSAAFRHGFNNSLGMCAALLIVGCLRELLATGAVFGNQVIHAAPLPLAAQPSGGFVLVGAIAAVWCAIANLYTNYKHEEVRRLYAKH